MQPLSPGVRKDKVSNRREVSLSLWRKKDGKRERLWEAICRSIFSAWKVTGFRRLLVGWYREPRSGKVFRDMESWYWDGGKWEAQTFRQATSVAMDRDPHRPLSKFTLLGRRSWFMSPAGMPEKIQIDQKLNIHRTLFIKIHLTEWMKWGKGRN